jgi:hypothetical protein
VLALVLFLALSGTRQLTPPCTALIRVGCALLVCSIVIHLFGAQVLGAFGWSFSSWPYQIKIAFKEATEIAGWLLLGSGLCIAAGTGRAQRAPTPQVP